MYTHAHTQYTCAHMYTPVRTYTYARAHMYTPARTHARTQYTSARTHTHGELRGLLEETKTQR